MKIGDRIRIFRKINKITIPELAAYLNISAPTLRKMEKKQLFINMDIINLLTQNPNFDLKREELLKYYYDQKLEKELLVQVKQEKVFIVIPKDVSIAFGLENNTDIYCCYLNNKIILQHEDTEEQEFIKRKVFKYGYSFLFFLGQRVKYLQGQVIKLTLDIKKQVLTITY